MRRLFQHLLILLVMLHMVSMPAAAGVFSHSAPATSVSTPYSDSGAAHAHDHGSVDAEPASHDAKSHSDHCPGGAHCCVAATSACSGVVRTAAAPPHDATQTFLSVSLSPLNRPPLSRA